MITAWIFFSLTFGIFMLLISLYSGVFSREREWSVLATLFLILTLGGTYARYGLSASEALYWTTSWLSLGFLAAIFAIVRTIEGRATVVSAHPKNELLPAQDFLSQSAMNVILGFLFTLVLVAKMIGLK